METCICSQPVRSTIRWREIKAQLVPASETNEVRKKAGLPMDIYKCTNCNKEHMLTIKEN